MTFGKFYSGEKEDTHPNIKKLILIEENQYYASAKLLIILVSSLYLPTIRFMILPLIAFHA